MAVSDYVKNNISGTIDLVSGGTSLTLLYDKGDLSISGLKAVLNEDIAIERRGRFVNAVYGNRVYPTLSFSCWLTQFAEASGTGDAIDWLLNKDAYSAITAPWGSGKPWAWDLTYTVEGTDFGDAADHTFTCHDVQATVDFSEGTDGMTLAISGTIRGEISGDIDVAQIS